MPANTKTNTTPIKINPIIADKAKEMAQPNWLCSTEKATNELGLQPQTPIDEALKTTFQWYKSQGWL